MSESDPNPAPSPMDKDYLRLVAEQLDSLLPDNYAFIFLAAPFGNDPNRRVSYISNADRQECINTMKEFLITAGAEEDWMKHL